MAMAAPDPLAAQRSPVRKSRVRADAAREAAERRVRELEAELARRSR